MTLVIQSWSKAILARSAISQSAVLLYGVRSRPRCCHAVLLIIGAKVKVANESTMVAQPLRV
jgi:hypothetical protein